MQEVSIAICAKYGAMVDEKPQCQELKVEEETGGKAQCAVFAGSLFVTVQQLQ